MASGVPPWQSLLHAPSPGAHIIFWSDRSAGCDAALETFIRGAVAREDMLLIVLPRLELQALQGRLRLRGLDFDELVGNGYLVRADSEEVAPHTAEDLERLPRQLAGVVEFAKSQGRHGVTVVDGVAHLCFERRDQRMSEALERIWGPLPENVRVLCLYDARQLRVDRLSDAIALTRLHTDAITALGNDRFFVESVVSPVEA